MPRLLLLTTTLLILVPSLAPSAPVIDNPAEPLAGHQDLMLEELWRIGGEDDEENILGVISSVLADDQGNTYLLDSQLVEVLVYDADGEYLHSLGKRGDGPGEIRTPSSILFMPDGNLGLVQAFPGKVVLLERDGTPAGEYHPGGHDPSGGGFSALQFALSNGSHLAFSGGNMTRDEGQMIADEFVSSFDADGTMLTHFYGRKVVRDFRGGEASEINEFFPHRIWGLDQDGRIYIPQERNEYAISVYQPDGTLEKIIKKPFQSYERTAAEVTRAKDDVQPWRRRNREQMNIVVEPTDSDFQSLHVAEDGRLWVLTSRGGRDQAAGVHSTWDVFDPLGRFQNTVSLHCEGRSPGDRIFFPGGGKVVLVRNFDEAVKAFRGSLGPAEETDESEIDAEPLEVIVYKMTP